jgi:hypothetical protein
MAAIAPALCRADAPNLVRNGSFEDPALAQTGWTLRAYGGALLTRDAGAAHTGAAAARIELPASAASAYPAFMFRVEGAKPGARFSGSVWARTDHVTDIGAYVVIEWYAADGRRIDFAQGDWTGPGTAGWRRLDVSGYAPPGSTALALGLVAHGTGMVWFDDAELHLAQPPPPPFAGDSVTLTPRPDRVLCERLFGFGSQGDFFLTLPSNTSHGVTEADVQRIFRRVAEMRPHVIRTFFDYKWWEPEEGRRTPGSPEMRDYIRWARFLKSIGTEILLTPWGDCFAYSPWMQAGRSRLPAPGKRDAMVRSLVDLVAYLRRDQGLTNVRYVALMNEPANDTNRQPDPAEFVRLNRLLDRMLRQRGLRGEIRILGVDDCCGTPTTATDWYRSVVRLGVEYCDAISVHTYAHRFVPALAPWMEERFRILRAAERGRKMPIVVTEFGYGGETYKNRENGKYEYGLFLADFAITALRERAAGALMWCLMDTYYGDAKQEYGLWRHGEEGWKPRPGFYSWSLVTRYTRPGSRAIDVSVSPPAFDVRAVVLEAPGATTWLIVNRYPRSIRARLQARAGEAEVFIYSRETLASAGDGMLVPIGKRASRDGDLTLDLPAESFVLVREARRAPRRVKPRGRAGDPSYVAEQNPGGA